MKYATKFIHGVRICPANYPTSITEVIVDKYKFNCCSTADKMKCGYQSIKPIVFEYQGRVEGYFLCDKGEGGK